MTITPSALSSESEMTTCRHILPCCPCKEFLESVKHAQKAAALDQRWTDILRDTGVKGKVQNCAGEK
jgi:hypothetical protein